MDDGMDELRQTFFTECSELLTDMESRLMELEEGAQDSEQLNAIFRCAHSIKGGSGAFGFNGVMQFTHVVEALMDEMRSGHLLPTRPSIDTLLKSVDIVTQMLAAEQNGTTLPEDHGKDVLEELRRFTSGAGAAAPAPAAPLEASSQETIYTIRFMPGAELFTTGNEPVLLLRELSRMGQCQITTGLEGMPDWDAFDPTLCYLYWDIRLETTAPLSAVEEVFEFVSDIGRIDISTEGGATPAVAMIEESTPQVTATAEYAASAPVAAKAEAETPAKAATTGGGAAASIRVDLEKVDRLVNMVGELVITEAMLRAQMRHVPLEHLTGLMQGLDELSHHTRELQEAVMAVRMQPVKSIFSRMPRIVRDTAAQLGKDIQLILLGENTEVDKTVIEQLGDPLTHMIRNSVDHGIESPARRREAGKPEQGTIQLSAYHRSGRIIIEITDDGAGINRARVLSKAQEKGLVAADAGLSDEEIDHLVFLPGFSTAEAVTSVSGRGVGMDVVRRNIESLGGTVRITNRPGTGSVFTVSLPLTLAILDGMIVRVGQETYIVPITSIIETLRPKAADMHGVQGHSDVINVRGEFVPLIYLHSLFGIPKAEKDATKSLIVLVESGTQKLGLVVDELIGQQQVVIKSLEANSDPVKGISGATILGDGKVSLILEINELKSLCAATSGVLAA